MSQSTVMPTPETFPVELQRMILFHIPDTKTLRNLVKASPSFHQAYLTSRQGILSEVTIQELAARSIDLRQIGDICEIALVPKSNPKSPWDEGRPSPHLLQILRSIHEHFSKHNDNNVQGTRKNLAFSIDECIALRSLARIVSYEEIVPKRNQGRYPSGLRFARPPNDAVSIGNHRFIYGLGRQTYVVGYQRHSGYTGFMVGARGTVKWTPNWRIIDFEDN